MIKNIFKFISYPIRKYYASSMWESRLMRFGFHQDHVHEIMERNRKKLDA